MSTFVRYPIERQPAVLAGGARIYLPIPVAAGGAAADVAEVVFYTGDEGSTLTVNKPASFNSANQLLVFVANTNATTLASLNTASGDWTELGDPATLSNHQGKAWYHAYTGSEPASWTFNYGVNLLAGALIRITNADATPVLVQVASEFNPIASSDDSPTLTPSGTNDLLLAVLGKNGDGSTAFGFTIPSGMTARGSVQLLAAYQSIAVASEQLASGSATGVRTWTSVTPTGQQGDTFSVAVKSSGAGGESHSGAGATPQHSTTATTVVKQAAGAAASPNRATTATTGVKGVARAGIAQARATTSATVRKTGIAVGAVTAHPITAAAGGAGAPGASGTGTASVRAATTSTGVKGVARTGAVVVRPSTADSTRKQAAATFATAQRSTVTNTKLKAAVSAGAAYARPATVATTTIVPGGPGAAIAHNRTTAIGGKKAITAGGVQAHPTVATTGRKTVARAGAVITRSAAAATAVRGAQGAGVVAVQPSILATSVFFNAVGLRTWHVSTTWPGRHIDEGGAGRHTATGRPGRHTVGG